MYTSTLLLNMTILNLTIFIILELQMCISGVSLLISIPKACNKIIFVCTAVAFGVFTDFLNCARYYAGIVAISVAIVVRTRTFSSFNTPSHFAFTIVLAGFKLI